MLRLSFTLACLLVSTHVFAHGQFIDIYPKSQQEIHLILEAVTEQLEKPPAEPAPPIVMMLHGKEAVRFLKSRYEENRNIVDQAARLSAFGLIEVKICETWLRANNHGNSELFPFISTVPFGAGELERLAEEENYIEYAVDL